MDRFDPNRFRNRKPAFSTERVLGVPSHAPTLENPSFSSATEELTEDDVVFFGDNNAEPNHLPSTPSSSSSSTLNHHHHHHQHNHNHNHKGFGFGTSDAFGILAALPEKDASPNGRNGTHCFHKASSVSLSSSSSSSSSRLFPAIPKPPSAHYDRIPPSSVKYHQSAPVNVPILSPAMMRRSCDFDDDDDDAAVEDDEVMLPPHEIVARNSAQSPMLPCSVLEGMGRTLKGRDLRQVRNAIWRQTGFLD